MPSGTTYLPLGALRAPLGRRSAPLGPLRGPPQKPKTQVLPGAVPTVIENSDGRTNADSKVPSMFAPRSSSHVEVNVRAAGYAPIQQVLPRISLSDARLLLQSAKLPRRMPFPQSKIEHIVVDFVENRAADHIFGCMLGDHPEFDGIPHQPDGGHWKLFPKTAGSGDGPAKEMVNVTCGTAYQVCNGTANESIRMFSGEQLPIKKALSESFAVFNKMFTSVPGPSWPNHQFSQSATSCGTSSNVMYNACGGTVPQFPQMTIFDSLKLANVPFGIYVNDTCGPNVSQACGDVTPGWGTNTGDAQSTGLDPDVTMAGVARHKDRYFSHSLFYEQAAAGTLPAFVWISPAHEASDHPCFDLAKGERMLKDHYEALRNSPNWSAPATPVHDSASARCPGVPRILG